MVKFILVNYVAIITDALVETGLLDKVTIGRTHYYMNIPLMNLFPKVSSKLLKTLDF